MRFGVGLEATSVRETYQNVAKHTINNRESCGEHQRHASVNFRLNNGVEHSNERETSQNISANEKIAAQFCIITSARK